MGGLGVELAMFADSWSHWARPYLTVMEVGYLQPLEPSLGWSG